MSYIIVTQQLYCAQALNSADLMIKPCFLNIEGTIQRVKWAQENSFIKASVLFHLRINIWRICCRLLRRSTRWCDSSRTPKEKMLYFYVCWELMPPPAPPPTEPPPPVARAYSKLYPCQAWLWLCCLSSSAENRPLVPRCIQHICNIVPECLFVLVKHLCFEAESSLGVVSSTPTLPAPHWREIYSSFVFHWIAACEGNCSKNRLGTCTLTAQQDTLCIP